MQALIEKRYKSQLQDKESLTELILDGAKIKEISLSDQAFVESLSDLSYLSCSQVGLRSIKNFPHLPNLTKLDLQDNSLSDPLELSILSSKTPILTTLGLGGNKFKDLDAFIKCLANIKNLQNLSVEFNLFEISGKPVSLSEIQTVLFTALPNLKVIDHKDRNGNECYDDDFYDEDEEEDVENEASMTLKEFYQKDFSIENNEDDDDESYKVSVESSDPDEEDFDNNFSSHSSNDDSNDSSHKSESYKFKKKQKI